MRVMVSLVVLLVAGCGTGPSNDGITSRIPVSVAGITYQWPSDGSVNPDELKGFALIPEGVWNGSVGTIPSANLQLGGKPLTVWLSPARTTRWRITRDGSGLPLNEGERFSRVRATGTFTIGKVEGEGIVNPGTEVVFAKEGEAYAQCLQVKPDLSGGSCVLFVNDRGVMHTLPLRWGAWNDVSAILKQYRLLIGMPTPASD